MKYISTAIPFVFMIFFAAGLVMGFTYTPPETPAATPPAQSPLTINSFAPQEELITPSKQLNVLLIGVEEVESINTRLMSMWLIIVPQGNREITFMPIYPQPRGYADGQYAAAHEPVWVNSQSPESATIVRLLADESTWWDEIVLVDATGITDLLNMLGGAGLYSDLTGFALGLNGAPTAWENPGTALDAQASLIRRICEQNQSLQNLENLIQLSPDQLLLTNNQVDLFSVLFNLLTANNNFRCLFPTLD